VAKKKGEREKWGEGERSIDRRGSIFYRKMGFAHSFSFLYSILLLFYFIKAKGLANPSLSCGIG
jgi:hypothetical protein